MHSVILATIAQLFILAYKSNSYSFSPTCSDDVLFHSYNHMKK